MMGGAGFTVTVTVNGVPVQPEIEGVTLYTTVLGVLFEFVSVPLMPGWFVPAAKPPTPL